jgi:hypothetical protein
MGTRCDFYVGRGTKAEWLGSIAWDGDPRNCTTVIRAESEVGFRENVATLLAAREDGTTPDRGWPWPWNDSRTTDYACAFDDGKVWASCFGRAWFDPTTPFSPDENEGEKCAVFPDMSNRRGSRTCRTGAR